MENNLFGFIIDNDIQLDIANKRLTRIDTVQSGRTVMFVSVELNNIMLRLLVFMLWHSESDGVPKEKILKHVWDDINLSSSNQCLWRTIKELRLKLNSIGLPDDFILNVRGEGYSLNKVDVIPLFYGTGNQI